MAINPHIHGINTGNSGEINSNSGSGGSAYASDGDKSVYTAKIKELRGSIARHDFDSPNAGKLDILDGFSFVDDGSYKGFEKVKGFMDALGGEENFANDLKNGEYTRNEVESMMKEAGLTKTDLRNYKKVKAQNKNMAKMFGLGE